MKWIRGKPLRGTYAIRDVQTGWLYFGRAENIPARRSTHMSNLRRGAHHCRGMQLIYNASGPSAFQFAVIEVVSPNVSLIKKETLLLRMFPAVFNYTYESDSYYNEAVKHSDNPPDPTFDWSPLFISKIFCVQSPGGDVYIAWNLSELARVFEISAVALSAVARGVQSHHKGWRCWFVDSTRYAWEKRVGFRRLEKDEPVPDRSWRALRHIV
jgi:hypothetical protein